MSSKNSKQSTKKVRIGFDFDKVLVNYPPLIPDQLINWIYKKRSKTLKYRFPGTFEQKIRIVSHYPFFRHPVTENINTVKILHKNNIPVFLISGRFGFLKHRTDVWLKKHALHKYFKEIHFNFNNEQPHIFKDRIIKSLGITHFVDDDLDLLLYLAKHNPTVSFYWFNPSKITKRYVPFENIHTVSKVTDFQNL